MPKPVSRLPPPNRACTFQCTRLSIRTFLPSETNERHPGHRTIVLHRMPDRFQTVRDPLRRSRMRRRWCISNGPVVSPHASHSRALSRSIRSFGRLTHHAPLVTSSIDALIQKARVRGNTAFTLHTLFCSRHRAAPLDFESFPGMLWSRSSFEISVVSDTGKPGK